MALKTPARRKPRRRKKKRPRRSAYERWRRRAAWAAIVAVAATGVYLYLYVAVSRRFDGRLWRLPAKIYADAFALRPGVPTTSEELLERLARSGFARVAGAPTHPGQYRVLENGVEIYRRSFDTPDVNVLAERVRVLVRDGRIQSVQVPRGDAGGWRRSRETVRLEPELLATLYGDRHEERTPLRLDDVPPGFVDAVLAAEDIRFRRHHGVDPRGILRAAATNVRQGKIVQGGSTITQQTVKNLFLDQQRTWWRKGREALMSLVLDAHYSKDRILEVYLNEVYLGQRRSVAICGAQAAARFYFGRDLDALGLAEHALLAGMISSPGLYNPNLHPERALLRRDRVLEAMFQAGMVDEASRDRALAQPLALASGKAGYSDAPYVVDYIRARLAEWIDPERLDGEGLRVYTTVDTIYQIRAERAMQRGLSELERGRPALTERGTDHPLQGAMVVTRPESGALLALIGGRDYRQSQFNRAVQAHRQPGSCFKPFVYAAGFELDRQNDPRGIRPSSLIEDRPLRLRVAGKIWEPSNYDRRYRGAVTARKALEDSLNVPTVRAAGQIGIPRIVETAHRCGIESPMDPVPSLALGTAEVTPLELAEAYGTLAHGGIHTAPWVVRTITDAEGSVLYRRSIEGVARRAISAETAYQVTDVLEGVFDRGTARSARRLGYHGRAAGKTGTTDDTRDAWFAGYTEGLLSLVWVGFDDNTRTGLTGATGALPIWVDFMLQSTRRGGTRVPVPDDIVVVRVDPESGARAGRACPRSVRERFVRGTEPTEPCPLHEGRFRRWWRRLRGKEDPGGEII